MDYKELENAVSVLQETTYRLEETYIATEGECTGTTEQMEAEIEALKFLLNGEGVDFLGRWLKSKEDRKKALKAERDYISRQIEANDKTIEFIKAKIRQLMDATGCVKVKGEFGYSFATSTSTKSVSLSASISKFDGELLPIYYDRTETPTITFTKPRAKKED